MAKFTKSQIDNCKILMMNFIFEDDIFSKTTIIVEDESGNQYTIDDININNTSTDSEIKVSLNSKLLDIDKISPIIITLEEKSELIGKCIKDI